MAPKLPETTDVAGVQTYGTERLFAFRPPQIQRAFNSGAGRDAFLCYMKAGAHYGASITDCCSPLLLTKFVERAIWLAAVQTSAHRSFRPPKARLAPMEWFMNNVSSPVGFHVTSGELEVVTQVLPPPVLGEERKRAPKASDFGSIIYIAVTHAVCPRSSVATLSSSRGQVGLCSRT